MIPQTELNIRLTRGSLRPHTGERRLNSLHGGPETLLGWLETQLGLQRQPVDTTGRVTEYLTALDACSDSSYAESLAADRWATGARLLELRDELRLAGWGEEENSAQPTLVQDMARAAQGRQFTQPGEAERLAMVLQALENGQTLPAHRCVLSDPVEAWPALWQLVLDRLTTEPAEKISPHATGDNALKAAQAIISDGQRGTITPDNSFRYVSVRSDTTACEFVARALAHRPDLLGRTVVLCESDPLAIRLDATLLRLGLPTMGARTRSMAHPVMQVLPSTLTLLLDPVDPQLLLDFLTLPVGPIPKRAAYKLARSLSEQPGLGSSEWEKTLGNLCSPEQDPDGQLRERVNSWLLAKRVDRGTAAPTRQVRQRCNLVAQWAAGRAATMAMDDQSSDDIIGALQALAGRASALGELVESQGKHISEPQLSRLLEETVNGGVETTGVAETSAGPMRVRSLAEIAAPCSRLVWLGLGTEDAAPQRWSQLDRAILSQQGIELDDGSIRVSAVRRAEAAGFAFVEEALLAVLLPTDTTRRWHPLWLAARNALGEHNEPVRLEDHIAAGGLSDLQPFNVDLATQQVQPPPKERLLWTAPHGTLQDRDKASASELHDRLACPLKWTLKYQAKIAPSSIAELPARYRLKGTFCHSVLERVFGGGGPLPPTDEAVELVADAFDERLPLDAAPLAQPGMAGQRRRLRDELCSATRTLVDNLSAGGYRIAGIEYEIDGQAMNKPLMGWIDCLAVREDGQEAVIDFKYSRSKTYRELLADGRAVQLATYAHARSQTQTAAGVYPTVAYLTLTDGQLLTPSGSALPQMVGRAAVDGPDIRSVWERFAQTIERADDWLQGTTAVPARPLQEQADWPTDTDIVLDPNLKPEYAQHVCRYCDYQSLCGLRSLK